jgi:N utilization substance protein B
MTAENASREFGTERRVRERPRRESRHAAREAAVQMLYQWEVGRISMVEAMSSYWTMRNSRDADQPDDGGLQLGEELRAFATTLTSGVAASIERIDPLIADVAEHWRIERMAVIDRIVLRLAVYEFLEQPDTPARVVINEALELARTFSTDEAVRFINGILDGIRRRLERE